MVKPSPLISINSVQAGLASAQTIKNYFLFIIFITHFVYFRAWINRFDCKNKYEKSQKISQTPPTSSSIFLPSLLLCFGTVCYALMHSGYTLVHIGYTFYSFLFSYHSYHTLFILEKSPKTLKFTFYPLFSLCAFITTILTWKHSKHFKVWPLPFLLEIPTIAFLTSHSPLDYTIASPPALRYYDIAKSQIANRSFYWFPLRCTTPNSNYDIVVILCCWSHRHATHCIFHFVTFS